MVSVRKQAGGLYLKKENDAMKIVEVTTLEEMMQGYQVLCQLYPPEKFAYMEEASFRALLPEMQAQGYRQIMVLDEQEKCVAIAGFNVAIRLYIGRIMRVHHLVVDQSYRGKGISKNMIEWLEQEAKQQQAEALVLDSTLMKTANHAYYHHMGFEEFAKHFVRWVH